MKNIAFILAFIFVLGLGLGQTSCKKGIYPLDPDKIDSPFAYDPALGEADTTDRGVPEVTKADSVLEVE